MIFVGGATGDLGGRIVRHLVERGQQVRALVRPATDASQVEGLGVEVVRGDLREPATLVPALAGVDTVVLSATAIGRILAGSKDLSISGDFRDVMWFQGLTAFLQPPKIVSPYDRTAF